MHLGFTEMHVLNGLMFGFASQIILRLCNGLLVLLRSNAKSGIKQLPETVMFSASGNVRKR
jgi:hypothetical protein